MSHRRQLVTTPKVSNRPLAAGQVDATSGCNAVPSQPVDATPSILIDKGLWSMAFTRRGLATIRGCPSTSEKGQETAPLAISADFTGTCCTSRTPSMCCADQLNPHVTPAVQWRFVNGRVRPRPVTHAWGLRFRKPDDRSPYPSMLRSLEWPHTFTAGRCPSSAFHRSTAVNPESSAPARSPWKRGSLRIGSRSGFVFMRSRAGTRRLGSRPRCVMSRPVR